MPAHLGSGSQWCSFLGQHWRPVTLGRLECGVWVTRREPKMLYVNGGICSWVTGTLPHWDTASCVTL